MRILLGLILALVTVGATSCSSADAYRNELFDGVNFTVMTNTIGQNYATAPKLVAEVLETNAWDMAVANYEKGLHKPHEWRLYDPGNICFTNISFMETGTIYWGGGILGKCPEEHVKDYPVESDDHNGVQWRRDYETVINIGGSTVTNLWIKYDYPHEKITYHKTVKLIKQVTVTTNIVDVVPAQVQTWKEVKKAK